MGVIGWLYIASLYWKLLCIASSIFEDVCWDDGIQIVVVSHELEISCARALYNVLVIADIDFDERYESRMYGSWYDYYLLHDKEYSFRGFRGRSVKYHCDGCAFKKFSYYNRRIAKSRNIMN